MFAKLKIIMISARVEVPISQIAQVYGIYRYRKGPNSSQHIYTINHPNIDEGDPELELLLVTCLSVTVVVSGLLIS